MERIEGRVRCTAPGPSLLVPPEQQKQQTLHALLTILLRIAARQPVLFVMEDLHWVDPSTLELLTLLVDQGPTARILALFTCRPEFSPPWTGRAHLTQITVTRLPRRQAVELYRLREELLLGHEGAGRNVVEAEQCFRQALATAQHQHAKSLELRAAMSLSRLWQVHGQRAAARQLLAERYGWFTEGFDTADLQDARVLLAEFT